jgi:hypothetical protein
MVTFLQAFTSLERKSLTYDELVYIPAGYSYVATGDYRLNREQPPLMKLLAGIGMMPLHPRLPLEHSSWAQAAEPGSNAQWEFGRAFLLEANPNGEALIEAARIPIVMVTLLLVVVAYLFARDLYGRRAGLLAAWLATFSPNILAHGRLATTDLGLSCFVLMAVYGYHRFTRMPTPGRLLFAGVALGLALAAKFSGVLLLALLGLWAVALPMLPGHAQPEARAFGRLGLDRLEPRAFSLVSAAAIVVVGLLTVSLTYGAPGRVDLYFRDLATVGFNTQPAFVTYFNGESHPGGVWYYFLAAFLLKTPLALLLLLALRVGLEMAGKRDPARVSLLLLSPVALWLGVVSWRAFQVGVRYVLPAYPLLFVYAAGVLASERLASRSSEGGLPATATALRATAALRATTALLALWFAATSLRTYPHYLPYFNELAGGPENGIEWLDDSNVDWGQDLLLLREYLAANDIRDVVVTPMALYDPALYGIEATVPPRHLVLGALSHPNPPPGVYAVSVHLLNRIRMNPRATVDPFRDLTPRAVLGHTIYVFEFP